MGFMDRFKGMMDHHRDKADRGADKAADAAESRFRGRRGKRTGDEGTGKQTPRDRGDRPDSGGAA